MSEERPGHPRRAHFQEAIAHWQLRLQTEVKKASSLPTAMFDACDPMLEAKLAEATQGIFAWLMNQSPPDGDRLAEEDKRLEHVSVDDLARLAARLAASAAPTLPELVAGQQPEYLGILADACSTGDPVTQQHAARHLQRDFQLAGKVTDADLAGHLLEQLQKHLTGEKVSAEQVERTSHCIAAIVLQAMTTTAPGELQ